jgi:RNA polymerase-binding protein DksA
MEIKEIRTKLESQLQRLLARLMEIDGQLRSASSQDSGERAVEIENDEVLERLDEAERKEVQAIRQAITRIDAGTYTVCSSCGGTISSARLEAIPYIDLCVSCAAMATD